MTVPWPDDLPPFAGNYSLSDAIEGLYVGRDQTNGIKDPVLLEQLKAYFRSLSAEQFDNLICAYLWRSYLCPVARQQGYGHEDVLRFLEWIDNYENA